MTVTFFPAKPAAGATVLGASIHCAADPRQDRRRFRDYTAAAAGLAEHHRFCTDPWCGGRAGYVVEHRSTDDEPRLDVASVHARTLLRALGLCPEIGAGDLHPASMAGIAPSTPQDAEDALVGSLPAELMLGRVELALAAAPADAGVPVTEHRDGAVLDFGRPAGWLQDRLSVLREVTLYALAHQRDVVWV
ncbi:hypothetical protein FRP1_30210 (plasmid) [Pseudonocardia sp. EC080625-04]|uniref:hypothetical protein n=1 Tax=unclassified Pseudonocardia TaxID=2619320 RepID=UPI0006CB6411|nr:MULTISPECIES: hypothetical protein [unclassified Pseudonocardia]ALE76989.1 hypothetical protein FRP1_30210 [Pseudonocardia sp. EC080625-04]ALL85909.1 hypothetical protein AD017_32945 [Pseudonocardia sp. EC080619-01]